MTTITLEAIETANKKVAEMIAAFKKQPAISFPITLTLPEMREGERFVGILISADGSKRHHIVLVPGDLEPMTWKDAMALADKNEYEIPDRCEGAFLFATMKEEFQKDWYWSCEEYASESDCAWSQDFGHGGQNYNNKNRKLRVRFVRRFKLP